MMKKTALAAAIFFAAFFVCGTLSAQNAASSADKNSAFEWKTDSPKNLGLDEKKISAFNAALLATEVTSCIIVKDGVIASEYYKSGYGQESVFSMQSVSKSVTSAIVGIAIERGFFGLDDPITKFFPELSKKNDARYQKITVRHLLANTSGLVSTDSAVWGAWRSSGDWIDFLFSRPIQHEAGKVFEYSTGNTHLLSAIVQRTTGKTLDEFGREVLFEPLGLKSARFDPDPQGISDGGNGAHLSARDMARFGLLYLRGGSWQGKQIVPANWVSESTKIQTPNMARYGYQWWIRYFGAAGARGFFAHGWGEQVIAVIPSKNLVISFSSRYPDNRLNATYWKWIGDVVDAVE